ncbi:hypothetical protein N9H57_03445 [Flavobacteriaceae bacterium]|nr:hypothetical protein [Flavobacteriaceae bacterium]MDA9015908.1 hypothetical protein [Flavobacteriaceae bacterium]
MPAVTTLTFFSFSKNKFWAFKQMGTVGFLMNNIKGLQFYKFLGTGGGDGFSLWPDFSTYAFLGVWDDASDYQKCLEEHPVFLEYKQRSYLQRDLVLKPVKSHGKWSGSNPFKNIETKQDLNEPEPHKAVVITRATLRWSRLLSFWRSVPAASRAIQQAEGVSYFKGIGEWPFIQQATVSIWDNFEAVKTFAYEGAQHAKIVQKTREKKWYKEDLFSRFYLISDVTKKLSE